MKNFFNPKKFKISSWTYFFLKIVTTVKNFESNLKIKIFQNSKTKNEIAIKNIFTLHRGEQQVQRLQLDLLAIEKNHRHENYVQYRQLYYYCLGYWWEQCLHLNWYEVFVCVALVNRKNLEEMDYWKD